jgi:ubiquinone/menaquinone biosynthesis C-methylase UbiE
MTRRYKAIAAYYDAENAHHAMLQQDVSFFLQHLPKRRQSVLEIAVGTGRAAMPIAQAGHRVVGIDYDSNMLAIAKRKRDSVGLKESELELIRADALTLNLKRKFDWICILFNTFLAFTTLKEQDKVLQNLRRHLKPRGRLWIDIFQPSFALLAQERSKNLEPGAFYVSELARTVYRTTDVTRDPSQQVQRVTFNYRWFDQNEVLHREKQEFDMTFIFPRELQLLIERNGMKIENLYGNYDGSRVNNDSPRLIVSCRLA